MGLKQQYLAQNKAYELFENGTRDYKRIAKIVQAEGLLDSKEFKKFKDRLRKQVSRDAVKPVDKEIIKALEGGAEADPEEGTTTGTTTEDYSHTVTENERDLLAKTCKKHGLPVEFATSFKFVNHQGQAALNIAFHPDALKDIAIEDKIKDFDNAAKEFYKEFQNFEVEIKEGESGKHLVLQITDLHVGMNPNKDGNSLWEETWTKEDILQAASTIVKKVLLMSAKIVHGYQTITVVLTGDLVDGFNSKTTRGGHDLPQIMNNIEQSQVLLLFLEKLYVGLSHHFKEVFMEAVSNSNHGGHFEHLVLSHFQSLAKYKHGAEFNLTNKMAKGFFIPGTKKPVMIAHGKDQEFAMRGLPPIISDSEAYKVDTILDALFKEKLVEKPIVLKGDSHVFGHQNKKNFHYISGAANSPDSDYCKHNFFNPGKGRFTMVVYDQDLKTVEVSEHALD